MKKSEIKKRIQKIKESLKSKTPIYYSDYYKKNYGPICRNYKFTRNMINGTEHQAIKILEKHNKIRLLEMTPGYDVYVLAKQFDAIRLKILSTELFTIDELSIIDVFMNPCSDRYLTDSRLMYCLKKSLKYLSHNNIGIVLIYLTEYYFRYMSNEHFSEYTVSFKIKLTSKQKELLLSKLNETISINGETINLSEIISELKIE